MTVQCGQKENRQVYETFISAEAESQLQARPHSITLMLGPHHHSRDMPILLMLLCDIWPSVHIVHEFLPVAGLLQNVRP